LPLTAITGIFGMNFVEMPLLKNRTGFWITMGMIGTVVVDLLVFLPTQAVSGRPTAG
jgi:magnesium transporter